MDPRESQLRGRWLLMAGLLASAAAACNEGGTSGGPLPSMLTVWNRSQFELLAVYVHRETDYLGTENLLAEPLPIDAVVDVALYGGQSVTVVRKKIEVGEEIALTTARGLDEVDGPGYTLMVFDDGFRLMEPTP